jgi:hypothetical protein
VGGAEARTRRTQNTPSWWAGKPDPFWTAYRDHHWQCATITWALSALGLDTDGLPEIKDPSKFCSWRTACPANGSSQPLLPSSRILRSSLNCTLNAHRAHRCRLCSRTQTGLAFVPQTCKNQLRIILYPASYLLALFTLSSVCPYMAPITICFVQCLSESSTAQNWHRPTRPTPLASQST